MKNDVPHMTRMPSCLLDAVRAVAADRGFECSVSALIRDSLRRLVAEHADVNRPTTVDRARAVFGLLPIHGAIPRPLTEDEKKDYPPVICSNGAVLQPFVLGGWLIYEAEM